MEPQQLKSGKAFHRLVQRYYEHESQFQHERSLVKATSGSKPGAKKKRGRADLLGWVEDDLSYVVIIEVKFTDWDKLAKRGTVRRNLASHRRQLWSYIDGEVTAMKNTPDEEVVNLEELTRQIAVVYLTDPLIS